MGIFGKTEDVDYTNLVEANTYARKIHNAVAGQKLACSDDAAANALELIKKIQGGATITGIPGQSFFRKRALKHELIEELLEASTIPEKKSEALGKETFDAYITNKNLPLPQRQAFLEKYIKDFGYRPTRRLGAGAGGIKFLIFSSGDLATRLNELDFSKPTHAALFVPHQPDAYVALGNLRYVLRSPHVTKQQKTALLTNLVPLLENITIDAQEEDGVTWNAYNLVKEFVTNESGKRNPDENAIRAADTLIVAIACKSPSVALDLLTPSATERALSNVRSLPSHRLTDKDILNIVKSHPYNAVLQAILGKPPRVGGVDYRTLLSNDQLIDLATNQPGITLTNLNLFLNNPHTTPEEKAKFLDNLSTILAPAEVNLKNHSSALNAFSATKKFAIAQAKKKNSNTVTMNSASNFLKVLACKDPAMARELLRPTLADRARAFIYRYSLPCNKLTAEDVVEILKANPDAETITATLQMPISGGVNYLALLSNEQLIDLINTIPSQKELFYRFAANAGRSIVPVAEQPPISKTVTPENNRDATASILIEQKKDGNRTSLNSLTSSHNSLQNLESLSVSTSEKSSLTSEEFKNGFVAPRNSLQDFESPLVLEEKTTKRDSLLSGKNSLASSNNSLQDFESPFTSEKEIKKRDSLSSIEDYSTEALEKELKARKNFQTFIKNFPAQAAKFNENSCTTIPFSTNEIKKELDDREMAEDFPEGTTFFDINEEGSCEQPGNVSAKDVFGSPRKFTTEDGKKCLVILLTRQAKIVLYLQSIIPKEAITKTYKDQSNETIAVQIFSLHHQNCHLLLLRALVWNLHSPRLVKA